MEYSFDIFDKNPERLAAILADNCRKRRLDRGLSRRSLSEMTGIPEPTLERFETKGKISLEAFLKLVVEFGWFDEMSAIMGKSKFTTGEELKTRTKEDRKDDEGDSENHSFIRRSHSRHFADDA